MTYEIFDPKVDRPLHELTRSEARRHFEHHLLSISDRINELKKLTEIAGIKLDFTKASIEKLDYWFPKEIKPNIERPQEPDKKSFSICNDVAIYLGESIRKKSNWIEWSLNTLRKSDISYHRPVLTNFRKIKNKNYNIDLDIVLCQYAHRILKGEIENNRLTRMFESSIEKS